MKKRSSIPGKETPENSDEFRPVGRPGNIAFSSVSEEGANSIPASDMPEAESAASPEIILSPEVIPSPEEIPSPEIILSPEVIPSPEEIPSPEVIPAPEVIPLITPDNVRSDDPDLTDGAEMAEVYPITEGEAEAPELATDISTGSADSTTVTIVGPGPSDIIPMISFGSEEPGLFRESDELIFSQPEEEDPDLHGMPAVRISQDATVYEPRLRKLSWLKPRHIITPLVAISVVLLFIFVIYIGPKNERAASPLMIRGNAVSNAEFSFMYHYVLLENGVDILSKDGRDMLASSPENSYETYRDLFLDMTAKEMQTTAILYDDAVAHGYNIGPEYRQRVQIYINWLSERAAAISVDPETYIRGTFGESVTQELILDVLSRKFFTEDYAYGQKLEELRASEDQAEEAYASSPNQYDQISYRLLRIVFEQKEDSFIATAHLHALEIIEKINHDQSKFETVAAEYFSGEAKEKLLQPDSTLLTGMRFNNVTDIEWRIWLFDPIRNPGDCIVYEDADGFPILLCFTLRQRQLEPLRNVRVFFLRQEDTENGVPGIPAVDIMAKSRIVLHSVTDEASMQDLETTYAEDIALGIMSMTHSIDTHRGKLDPAFDEWIFDPARKPGDKTDIITPEGIAILFYIEASENPEWYDRVNSFIRMSNFQEFLLAKQEEYPYAFNKEGLKGI